MLIAAGVRRVNLAQGRDDEASNLVLVGLTFFMFRAVPGGFVPSQDKQYLVGFAQLPDGATARSHRGRHPPHERYRAQDTRHRERGGVSRVVDQRLHQQLQWPASCSLP